MFYWGNFLIYLGLDLATEPVDDMAYRLSTPETFVELFISVLMIVLGFMIIKKRFESPHRINNFMKGFGITLIILSALGLIGIGDYFYPSDVLLVCSFLIPGILITAYNSDKKIKAPERVEVIEEKVSETEIIPVDSSTPLERVILNKYYAALQTRFVQRDKDLYLILNHSAVCLEELIKREYHFNKHILEQIDELLTIYLELSNQRIQTKKSKDLLIKVISTLALVDKAFEKMYDNSFEETAYNVESDIKTLEMKLKSEGLLGSDFDELED